jgi:hypothetical protein
MGRPHYGFDRNMLAELTDIIEPDVSDPPVDSPLLPEHLRVIMAGLQLIAAEVAELKKDRASHALVRRYRAAFEAIEWAGIVWGDEECCLFCGAHGKALPATTKEPAVAGHTHRPGCLWQSLMADSSGYA